MTAPMDRRVVEAVGAAYYARAISAPDLARVRAQSGFAIASFLAGGLAGAVVLSSANVIPVPVRAAASIALAAWVLSAVLYAHAVSEPIQLATSQQPDDEAFVQTVLNNSANERDKVDRRRRWGYWVSAAAAIATALTALLSLLSGENSKDATVLLTPRGNEAIRLGCGATVLTVRGALDTASIEKNFVKLRLQSPECKGREVGISRSDVIQILYLD